MGEVPLPDAVLAKARVAGAQEWVAGLPRMLAAIEREWGIAVDLGEVFGDASEALVCGATTSDGVQVVLKVIVPRAGNHHRHEVTALRLAEGEGMVRLLRYDDGWGALLLERLGPALSTLDKPLAARLEILCDAAAKVWRPVTSVRLPTGREKAAWLASFISATWERLGRPCSADAVDYALECCARRGRAHDDATAVLVHGDVHQWNALQGGDGAFRLVDPDGLVAEAEYDLGVLLREDPEDAPALRERARMLAARTGLDEVAIWEWGVAERVSTGLLLTEIGVQPVGRDMLAAADLVADRYRP